MACNGFAHALLPQEGARVPTVSSCFSRGSLGSTRKPCRPAVGTTQDTGELLTAESMSVWHVSCLRKVPWAAHASFSRKDGFALASREATKRRDR